MCPNVQAGRQNSASKSESDNAFPLRFVAFEFYSPLLRSEVKGEKNSPTTTLERKIMRNHFTSYRIAVEFHHACREVKLPDYLQDQLLRASSSIALCLAEGAGRSTKKDQVRFFFQALGSLRECQACLDLAPKQYPNLIETADSLGAHLFRLCHH